MLIFYRKILKTLIFCISSYSSMQSPITSQFGGSTPVTPPLKGSFPLDYHQTCHLEMLKYLCCLKETRGQNTECRHKSFDYFKCRMDNGLMDRDEWPKLGFKDLELQQQEKEEAQNNQNRTDQ